MRKKGEKVPKFDRYFFTDENISFYKTTPDWLKIETRKAQADFVTRNQLYKKIRQYDGKEIKDIDGKLIKRNVITKKELLTFFNIPNTASNECALRERIHDIVVSLFKPILGLNDGFCVSYEKQLIIENIEMLNNHILGTHKRINALKDILDRISSSEVSK